MRLPTIHLSDSSAWWSCPCRAKLWKAHFSFVCALVLLASPPVVSAQENRVTVLEKEGKVEAALAGTNVWSVAQTNQALHVADRIRTGERSRATLHLLDQSTMRMFELSEFLIGPLPSVPGKPSFSL